MCARARARACVREREVKGRRTAPQPSRVGRLPPVCEQQLHFVGVAFEFLDSAQHHQQ